MATVINVIALSWLGVVLLISTTHVIGHKQHRYTWLTALVKKKPEGAVSTGFVLSLLLVFALPSVILITLSGFDETLEFN